MKKTVIALLVVAAVAAAGIALWRDDATQSIIESVEREGARVLGTRVDVAGADVRWDSGSVSLTEMEIANPGAFSARNMVTIRSIEASGDLRAGALEGLVFEGIDAVIEFRGAQSNFEVMAGRAVKAAGRQEGADPAATRAQEEGGAETDPDSKDSSPYPEDWRIESVGFEDIRVTVQADWTDEQAVFDVDNLVLKDVGGGSEDVARKLVLGFLSGVLESSAGRVRDSRLQDSLAERARKLRDRLEELESNEDAG